MITADVVLDFEKTLAVSPSALHGIRAVNQFGVLLRPVIATGPKGSGPPLQDEVISEEAAVLSDKCQYHKEADYWREFRAVVGRFERTRAREWGVVIDASIWLNYLSLWQEEAVKEKRIAGWWYDNKNGNLSNRLFYILQYIFVHAIGGPSDKTMDDYIAIWSRSRIPLFVENGRVTSYQFSPRHPIFWAKKKAFT